MIKYILCEGRHHGPFEKFIQIWFRSQVVYTVNWSPTRRPKFDSIITNQQGKSLIKRN